MECSAIGKPNSADGTGRATSQKARQFLNKLNWISSHFFIYEKWVIILKVVISSDIVYQNSV